jgi:hypothetical protein
VDVVLRLSSEEAEIMRRALVDQIRTLRDEARGHVSPYSPKGIALCQQRAFAEDLLDRLDNPARELSVVSPRPDRETPTRLAA